MIPKFHKPIIDFRYIVADIKSSTKQLSKLLSVVLTLVDNKLMLCILLNLLFPLILRSYIY